MINVYKRLKNERLESRLILQIHDELVFDVCADEKEELISAARDVMENIVNLNVPLKVSTDVGTDLYEAK